MTASSVSSSVYTPRGCLPIPYPHGTRTLGHTPTVPEPYAIPPRYPNPRRAALVAGCRLASRGSPAPAARDPSSTFPRPFLDLSSTCPAGASSRRRGHLRRLRWRLRPRGRPPRLHRRVRPPLPFRLPRQPAQAAAEERRVALPRVPRGGACQGPQGGPQGLPGSEAGAQGGAQGGAAAARAQDTSE